MPGKQEDKYEGFHQRNIKALNKKIRELYGSSVQELSMQAGKITWKGKLFDIKDYPQLEKQINSQMKKLHANVYAVTVNGIEGSWDLSNKKNDAIVDIRLLNKNKRSKKGAKAIYDPNLAAKEQFVKRKEKGLNLSDRVWKTVEPFKKEMEQGLGLGISSGKAARDIAKDMQQYLNDPDSLYRRVRSEDGKLKLSSNARQHKPGKGVYRSSYKNALRLAATETNMAYRASDHERWNNMPFVTGIEVKLSPSHPRPDICDQLKGEYPKDFKFVGWHPRCLCYATPKMLSDVDYDKFEDSILAGEEPDIPESKQVTTTPAGFNKYVKDNKVKLQLMDNPPYWYRDNTDHAQAALDSEQPQKIVPAAKTISTQFSKISSVVTKPVKKALGAIDDVHGDGDMPDIPFNGDANTKNLAAFYSNSAGTPTKITLSKSSPAPEFSIVHEMGHFLDLNSIGKPGTWASLQEESPLVDVIKAIKQTDTYKSIKKAIVGREITIRGKVIPVGSQLFQHLQYLKNPKELWARAYTQFIAKRSESKILLNQLEYFREEEKAIGLLEHWTDEDFLLVEEAIEKMMLDEGWIQ